ncbi:MAG: response regulator [Nitrososphaera sp.]
MRILIAEDEENISVLYRIALESRQHDVIVTNDGQQCVELYMKQIGKNLSQNDRFAVPPFDAVILDYRMPIMDGMDAAKHILRARAKQRIIFASAFVKETLVESIKELDQIVELLQKPFEIDTLVDTVEDSTIYQQLEKLNVNIAHLKDWKPTHAQIRDLLDGLLKLRKPDFDFHAVTQHKGAEHRYAHSSQAAR